MSMVRCTKAGSGSWWLLLRCGDCGTWHETFARDDAVAALHRAIEHGCETVAEEVEAFTQALELGLIDADDF
jgi:hypothetical protein